MSRAIDCACVIHGDLYTWQYVQNLHNMLSRNLLIPFKLHVFTEHERPVPPWAVHHPLDLWPGIEGRKKAWWYKMQLFNPMHGLRKMLYFDLDVVITNNIDWILKSDLAYFWTIRDFLHLWKPDRVNINSSIMYWDCAKYAHIWEKFGQQDINHVMKKYPGDQDWINAHIPSNQVKFFKAEQVKSWRWQVKDGGIDPNSKQYRMPETGSQVSDDTSVVIFHGTPKPHEITDQLVTQHWR